MSGHSKWSSIKHKKAATDAKRGKIFSKLSKEIMVAAREGGGDPDMNPRLRTVLETARAANMPADNIERAIKKGTGELEGVTYEEMQYAGYAPGGVAVLIDALTDNRNRTASEIRTIFNKNNGNLADVSNVAWMFERVGLFVVRKEDIDEDDLLTLALEAGADDMSPQEDGSGYEIRTSVENFAAVGKALKDRNIQPAVAEITYLPQNTVQIDEAKTARAVLRLLEQIEDQDDVQNVYANFDIPEEILAALSAS